MSDGVKQFIAILIVISAIVVVVKIIIELS